MLSAVRGTLVRGMTGYIPVSRYKIQKHWLGAYNLDEGQISISRHFRLVDPSYTEIRIHDDEIAYFSVRWKKNRKLV